MSPDNEPLTMRALQERICFPGADRRGRQLLRELKSREQSLGVRIVVRGHNGWPKATVAAVRRHAPDLIRNEEPVPLPVGNVGRLLGEFRRHLEAIDEKISAEVAEQIAVRCEPEFAKLWREIRTGNGERAQIAEGLRDLAGMVAVALPNRDRD